MLSKSNVLICPIVIVNQIKRELVTKIGEHISANANKKSELLNTVK